MDIDRPHRILPAAEISSDPEERARWIPLTDAEAEQLRGATEEQRHAWLKANIPTSERLSRHLRHAGLPVMASLAREGAYSDFSEASPHAMPKVELLRQLELARKKVARRKGEHSDKVMRISKLMRLVVAGEYDDNAAESDAWAAAQTGEVGALLDRLGLRPKGGA